MRAATLRSLTVAALTAPLFAQTPSVVEEVWG